MIEVSALQEDITFQHSVKYIDCLGGYIHKPTHVLKLPKATHTHTRIHTNAVFLVKSNKFYVLYQCQYSGFDIVL